MKVESLKIIGKMKFKGNPKLTDNQSVNLL